MAEPRNTCSTKKKNVFAYFKLDNSYSIKISLILSTNEVLYAVEYDWCLRTRLRGSFMIFMTVKVTKSNFKINNIFIPR